MKLRMIMGLLLAGSLVVGTAIQAQDLVKEPQDLTNLQEVAPQFDIPRVIMAVSVECNGNCGDNTLGQICAVAAPGLIPLAVDCTEVDDDGRGVACPGIGNNRCNVQQVTSGKRLNEFCRDTRGWDATVYCVAP